MHKDQLESYITEHRDAFDDAVPALKVWADIDRQLEAPNRLRLRRWKMVRMAAAVTVLLAIGGALGSYVTQVQSQNPMAILENVSPEYQEMAQYYQDEISRQVQLVSNSDQADPDVFADLEQIDAAMAELKQELLDAPRGKEQEIVENLIKTYQTKLAILQRVLERMNPTDNQPNNRENEISI